MAAATWFELEPQQAGQKRLWKPFFRAGRLAMDARLRPVARGVSQLGHRWDKPGPPLQLNTLRAKSLDATTGGEAAECWGGLWQALVANS